MDEQSILDTRLVQFNKAVFMAQVASSRILLELTEREWMRGNAHQSSGRPPATMHSNFLDKTD